MLGYEEPTPIQAEAIPPLLEGRDLLGEAATGTGKTAAFALPLLQRISAGGERGVPRALVLVPTRELAMQVSEAIHRYGRGLGARVVPVFGGQPIGRQLRALEQGADVVVATPGRALDHLSRGTLRLDRLAVVVLDEADEMLDMGFAEDIDTILAGTPEGAQTVALLGDHARAHRRDRPAPPHRPGPDPDRPRAGRRRRGAAGATERLRARARPQACRARAGARRGGAGRGDRLLPHPDRGRPARRHAQRPRLQRGGPARGHDAGAARPGDGAPESGHVGPADRDRRRGARARHRPAHPRRQLRRALGPRVVRPPHRSRRPGGARGGGRSRSPSPASTGC